MPWPEKSINVVPPGTETGRIAREEVASVFRMDHHQVPDSRGVVLLGLVVILVLSWAWCRCLEIEKRQRAADKARDVP